MDEQRQLAFAHFLDASWQSFRSQMLQAYSETLEASPLALQEWESRLRSKDSGLAKGNEYSDGKDDIIMRPSKDVQLLHTQPPTRLQSLHSFSEKVNEALSEVPVEVEVEGVAPPPDFEHLLRQQSEADSIFEGQNDVENDEQVSKEISDSATQAIRHRLQVRLGAMNKNKLISGKLLVNTVEALGLTTYMEDDMNEFVNTLADYIELRFVKKEGKNGFRRSHSSNNVFQFQDEHRDLLGRPVWHWPQGDESIQGSKDHGEKPKEAKNLVPLKALSDVFVTKDKELLKKIFGAPMMTQYEAMKEILLAGDTNRLVAELTFVRINDLAAPPEKIHPLIFIEPFVAVLILANGIMIGFQTDPRYEDWDGWIYLEVIFAVVLIMEVCLRVHLSGLKSYFCGSDKFWNFFDMFLLFTGLTDIVVELAVQSTADMTGASLLRFCRLVRLVRVVKVFRVKYMKELRLMVKGLVGGFRTLFLSFALLFAVLYVISGFATMTLGRDTSLKDDLLKHFENIPSSMFTAFRCFSGECFAESGVPIAAVLAHSHGLPFVMCYTASYLLVSLGIYNVILAVYVDITMRAAKESEAVTAEQHSRESIRIARTTRELLKKFAAAYRMFSDMDDHAQSRSTRIDFKPMESSFTDEDIHEHIAITKELFLLIIQDQSVQFLMDELELPHDRANLFEIIDADGSGTLHVTELVQGLLKIRGEVKKSDAVATLLATKAIQNMVLELKEDEAQFRHTVLKILQPQHRSSRGEL